MQKNKKLNKIGLLKWKNKFIMIIFLIFFCFIFPISSRTQKEYLIKEESILIRKNRLKRFTKSWSYYQNILQFLIEKFSKVNIQKISDSAVDIAERIKSINDIKTELNVDITQYQNRLIFKSAEGFENGQIKISLILKWTVINFPLQPLLIVHKNEQKVYAVKKLFENFEKKEDGITTNIPKEKISAKDIGFNDHSKDKRNGVDVSFKVIKHDDNKGTLNVKVKISKEGLSKESTFIIKGYQTINQKHVQEDKNEFINFDQNILNKPMAIADGKVDIKTLTKLNGHSKMPNIKNEVKRSFQIITNAQTGVAIVTITFSKGNYEESINYKIFGFKTLLEINKEEALKIVIALKAEDFSEIYNGDTKNRLSSHNSNQDGTKKDAIVDLIKKKTHIKEVQDLITNNLISFDSNNIKGELIIKIRKTDLDGVGTHDIVIDGFKTEVQMKEDALKIVRALKAEDFKAIYDDVKNKLASHNSNQDKTKKDAIIDLIKKKINIIGIETLITNNLISFIADNIKGELTIKFKKTFLGGEGTHDVIIDGFKTEAQMKEDALKIVIALKLEHFIRIYDDVNKNKLASHNSNRNARKKDAIVNFIKEKISSVGIETPITHNLISFVYDNTKGELTIQFKKTFLDGEGTHDVIIGGFKTEAKKKQKLLK